MSFKLNEAIQKMVRQIVNRQSPDGSWRYCFESGVMTDAYLIIVLRTLQMNDEEWIRMLHRRIVSLQERSGGWKVYPDELEGNLSATVEAYFALLYSGYSTPQEPHIRQAKQFIINRGGIRKVESLMTKVLLACTGQYPWPSFFPLPVELLFIPAASPIGFYDFSGYARIHLAPVMLLADKRIVLRNERTPDLSDLDVRGSSNGQHDRAGSPGPVWSEMTQFVKKLTALPAQIRQISVQRAEKYMLERIEPDGTLYSYSSATFLMIFALLSLNYDQHHPVIRRAVQGLKSIHCRTGGGIHLQNSTSTVWDTALISHALQQAGVSSEHSAIQAAGRYLLGKQHNRLGDWSRKINNPVPGGWGFSDINTMNPDVDDTTAALRAIRRMGPHRLEYLESYNRGLQWVMAMQNSDGGWPAFERNTDNSLLTLLPLNGADAAAIDPSSADLTGRTLEFLGSGAGLTLRHPFIRRAVGWLQNRQEFNGSWYGRWGICYIYGTWAALTGMLAVGEKLGHPSIRLGAEWLQSIQNPDGGWGESCASDLAKKYIPLRHSTLSQTAWAVDALVACYDEPNPSLLRGVEFLLSALNGAAHESYPTGAGLPGYLYIRYHSYPFIWPLLALSHYRRKFE